MLKQKLNEAISESSKWKQVIGKIESQNLNLEHMNEFNNKKIDDLLD